MGSRLRKTDEAVLLQAFLHALQLLQRCRITDIRRFHVLLFQGILLFGRGFQTQPHQRLQHRTQLFLRSVQLRQQLLQIRRSQTPPGSSNQVQEKSLAGIKMHALKLIV